MTVWGSGIGVWGWIGAWDLRFGVWSLGFEVWSLGLEVWDLGSAFLSTLPKAILQHRTEKETAGISFNSQKLDSTSELSFNFRASSSA